MATKKKRNYVNNPDFYLALVSHRARIKEADETNKRRPPASDYVGQAIMLIATRMARRPNFSGYSFKDEMVADAIADCVAAVDKFDPAKSQNPFAYFNQISWNAFVRRIHREKRQAYVKHANYEMFLSDQADVDHAALSQHLQYSQNLVTSYEKKMADDKAKKANKKDTSLNRYVTANLEVVEKA
jgi:DNA-directed RNA polymerase specialized sigma24 family protein